MKRLPILHPIIQAPMAGVDNPVLAAAVSNSGGLGSIAIGPLDASASREKIRAVRKLTNKPFNVNVFTHKRPIRDTVKEQGWSRLLAPEFAKFQSSFPAPLKEIYKTLDDDPAKVSMLMDEKIPIISMHFGLPSQSIIQSLKYSGSMIVVSVTSREEAKLAEEAGADFLVAQGIEAGGHRGVFDPYGEDPAMNTTSLLRELIKSFHLPIIAAGGLMSGQDVKGMLDQGAVACQLGTAFLLCPETKLDEAYRRRLTSKVTDTHMTSFVSGRPARSLKSAFTELQSANPSVQPPDYPFTYDAGKALHAAAQSKGSHDYGAYWAGAGFLNSRSLPAAALMKQIVKEFQGESVH